MASAGSFRGRWRTPPYSHDGWKDASLWALQQSNAGLNVYFSPVTRQPDATGRSEETAYELPVLFADVDLDGDANEQQGQAWENLSATGLVTAAVWSGSGFHPYGKLEEPILITDENREQLKDLSYSYGAGMNEAVHGRFVPPDRHDRASLLRVPGTVNYPNKMKRAEGREPSETDVCERFDNVVPLEAFENWKSRYPRRSGGEEEPTAHKEEIGNVPPDWEHRLQRDPILNGYWEMTRPLRGSDQSPSAYALAIANRLVHAYRDGDGEILAVMDAFYKHHGRTKSLQALRKTLARAKESPERATEQETSTSGSEAQSSATGREGPELCEPPLYTEEAKEVAENTDEHPAGSAGDDGTKPGGEYKTDVGNGAGEYDQRLTREARTLPGAEAQNQDKDTGSKEAEEIAPFPVQVLPTMLQRYVEEGALSMSCPPDFLAVPMLSIAGAAIGTTQVLEVKLGWTQNPVLYAAVVGEPGSAKSPALSCVAQPVYERQEKQIAEYKRALRKWQYEMNKAKGSGPPPVKPVAQRTFTADATTEALAVVVEENPRGIILISDELTGWVRGMGQYKQGRSADRQFWLSAWSCEPLTIDRKSNPDGPITIPKPFVSVAGCLTPDMLSELSDERGREDGFLHRVLFAYPAPMKPEAWTEAVISPEAETAWDAVLKSLWKPQRSSDDADPSYRKVWKLTRAAKEEWIAFFDAHKEELADEEFPYMLRGPWAKLECYAARFALILQLLRSGCAEADSEAVDEVSVRGAVALVDYFKSHTHRVYKRLPTSPQDAKPEKVLAWIRRKGGEVSARDLQRCGVAGIKNSEEAKAMFYELARRGCGTVQEREKGSVVFRYEA